MLCNELMWAVSGLMLPAFPDRPIPERLHMTLHTPYSVLPGRSSETGGAERFNLRRSFT